MKLRPSSVKIRRAVFNYWRYQTEHGWRMECEDCGIEIHPVTSRWEADHEVVREHGGSDDPPNVRPLCYACHRTKSGKDKSRIAKGQRQSDSVYGVKRSKGWKPEGTKYNWSRRRYEREAEEFEA